MKSISDRGGNIRLGSDPCGDGMNHLAGFGVPDALYPSPVALGDVPGIVQAAVMPISDVVHLPTTQIVGRILAADLRAGEALTGFEQSAVDGPAGSAKQLFDTCRRKRLTSQGRRLSLLP